MQHWPNQIAGYKRDLALAHSWPDEEIWEQEWNAGRVMTLEQIVAFAQSPA